MLRVLIVDDESIIHETLKSYLGITCTLFHARSKMVTLEILGNEKIDLVFLDINLEQKHSGIEILKAIKEKGYQSSVVMLTQSADTKLIRESLLIGAIDYLRKPIDRDELTFFLTKIKIRKSLEDENNHLRNKLSEVTQKTEIIGTNYAIQEILTKVERLKGHNSHILILGESGTGKELIARRLNEQEKDLSRPFIAINCAALPKSLIESILFGYETGAYTDAKEGRAGKFELADGGDIFLDEITCLDIELQSKLLRILQEKEVERIGSQKCRKVDFRVIAATNENPEKLIAEGKLREDLYYRLNTIEFTLPALRDRMEDLEALITYFMSDTKKLVSQEVMEIFRCYDWPGNIRELKQVIESAKIFSQTDEIRLLDIPPKIFKHESVDQSLGSQVRKYELELIQRTMKTVKSMREAARILGVSPATICNKMKEIDKIV